MEIEDIKGLIKGATYWVRVKIGTQAKIARMQKMLSYKFPEQCWLITDSSADILEIPTVSRDQLIKLAKKLKEEL